MGKLKNVRVGYTGMFGLICWEAVAPRLIVAPAEAY